MKEAVQIAEQVEAGFGTRFLRVPTDESREAYRDMEDFIESVPDRRLQDRLARAIRGKGAFGRFKDVLVGVPAERERWLAFRDARMRGALDWWLPRTLRSSRKRVEQSDNPDQAGSQRNGPDFSESVTSHGPGSVLPPGTEGEAPKGTLRAPPRAM
jgi:hypothetical protein